MADKVHIPMTFDELLRQAARHVRPALMKQWLNKVHTGDCPEILAKLPAESVGLVVAGPTGDDGRSEEEHLSWQRDCLTAMMRVLRADGAIFYRHLWRVRNGLLRDWRKIVDGFPVRQIIIRKRTGRIHPAPDCFLSNYEVIYLIAGPCFRLRSEAGAAGAVWEIPRDQVARRCIESTDAGIVLDPFMGDDTTVAAASACGRQWIGVKQENAAS